MAFGEIRGNPAGTMYPSYRAMLEAGVHRSTQAGMVGSATGGTESIVLNGGYPDDKDFGDHVIYPGHGGQDTRRRQVEDQKWIAANDGMRVNMAKGIPVRVIRGRSGEPAYSPTSGYRYDGLYAVVSAWQAPSQDGPLICRFDLVKTDEVVIPSVRESPPVPSRVPSTIMRIVQDTSVALRIKNKYDYSCQVCGTRLVLPGGTAYAEGAHLRPLGEPHLGHDVDSNTLCLCPNHHVLLDRGAIYIADDLRIIDGLTGEAVGRLRVRHSIEKDYLAYHRHLFGY